MSRVAKWKLEKTKVKVVFRLQFHATHIPQAGCDKLFISFIPADSGKATAKTTKANVRNGACKWGDPIYETTRLLQDSKSKQYEEKIYKFVVAMGSSRSSILGEACINLADYADALKPSIVALPLHGCDSGTILHVTVQLLTSKTGFREFEQQRELRERGLQTGIELNSHDEVGPGKVSSSVEYGNDQMDKVNARVRIRPESRDLPSLEQEVGLNEDYADSAVGFDGSSNTSESLYAEKHDASSTHEIESLKSTVSGDLNGLSHCQSPREEKGHTSGHRHLAQGSSDWVHGWSSDYSMDNDLAVAYEESSRLRSSLELAESSILELKLEISSLQSNADEIGIETQKFAHQLASEISSGEELAKEVSLMRSECSKLKGDLEQLRSPTLKGLSIVEDKIRELQHKLYLGFHDRDLRFLHSDMEALLVFLQGLKQGTEGTSCKLNFPSEIANMEFSQISLGSEKSILGNGLDLDLYQPPDMLHCLSIEPNSTGVSTSEMKGKIFELLRELDEAKAEREILSRKMDQMECYYEALVQELEENQKQMLVELQNLRNEHSTCLYTIATTSSDMESMREDMNGQILRFAEERRELDSINRELERRAITSEAALRRARLNYSIAVDQLQKDLDLLSFQVVSMFETNENLIKQALSETSQPCFLGHPDANCSPEGSDSNKVVQCKNQNGGQNKQAFGSDILLEDMKKSILLQEGLYLKVEEELSEMHVVNLNLDVFSKILQETLLEASIDTMFMEGKIVELARELDLSNKSKNYLMLQLQTAMDDVEVLNEYKASCTANCSDMALKNQVLEAKLESVSRENCLLTQKVTEWDALMRECRSYESKYIFCSTEKADLANLLKQETLENGNLQKEISSLTEDLKTVKSERDLAQVSSSAANSEIMAVKQKFKHDIHNMGSRVEMLNALAEKLQLELETLANKFHISSSDAEEKYVHQNEELLADLVLLELELEKLTSKNLDLSKEILDLDTVTEEVGKSKLKIAELTQETQDLRMSLKDKTEESVKLASELDSLKESLRFLQDELHVERSFRGNLEGTIADLTSRLDENQHFRQLASDLQEEKSRDCLILQQKHEECIEKLHKEISRLAEVDSELSKMDGYVIAADVKVIFLRTQCETQTEELRKMLFDVEVMLNRSLGGEAHWIEENAMLVNSVESLRLELKDSVAQHEHLSNLNSNMSVQLEECKKNVANMEAGFSKDKSEHGLEVQQLKHMLVLSQQEMDTLRSDLRESAAQYRVISDLNSIMSVQLEEYNKKVATSEVQLSNDKSEHNLEVQQLKNMLVLSKEEIDTLRLELKDYVTRHGVLSDLNSTMASHLEEYKNMLANVEVGFSKDKSEHSLEVEQLKHKLLLYEEDIDTLRLELKESVAQHGVLSDLNRFMTTQLEEYKEKLETLAFHSFKEKSERSLEVQQLKHILDLSEEEIDNLMSSKEELEITVKLFKAKLDEVHVHMASQDEYNDELTQRLSEQILKTEEFKNLSIHLRDLKEEAEAECAKAREKKEFEGQSVAMQDTLRIAFIKEQYENRLQELRQQLSVCKKHGEEMLWKLQDSVDELEKRKKSEASHLKTNEELSLKILELEAELQSVVSEKREKMKGYDRMKAELECALLSLECCREEKQMVEDSLKECNEENNRIAAELTLTQGQLENIASTMSNQKEEINRSDELGHVSGDTVLRKTYEENVYADGNGSTGKPCLNCMNQHRLRNCEELESASTTPRIGGERTVPANMQTFEQGDLVTQSEDGITKHSFLEQGALLQNDAKHLAVINCHFKTQRLKCSMDNLQKELERMKSENSLPLDDLHFDPNSRGLQTELVQLHKANEELRGIFPLFNEFPGSGNALERLLALEIELAEALRTKQKSNTLFQSSFLKQHTDEQAIFQSFRDINELIEEMLELKGRYAAVENELKDMHDRYSRLSLQFAEVEGERQRLSMTLKNARTPKSFNHLSRSSSATDGDHPL
ncbi:uncharacterized protein LOC131330747 isoform X3 [Rhododendron vialii]|uniref:uncharacterized protein LOC131330747 isoform X3 n=1 Tax=Rhododendron vialii TaxID=182163 RepID=UPI00265F98AA|nr:uncharacterized protein LOC131330747 isoform X3 [Rhododendron vialii]XP_058220414.1 uncharacterized protein LOC131330747 isoform X3 [Rhododendron vialii]XP_058220417.1 uncharacterized protein LOC131330747 isoform X3 [Rhododendron vialii]